VMKQTEPIDEIWKECLGWALEKDAYFSQQYQLAGLGQEPCDINDLFRLPEYEISRFKRPFECLNLPLSSVDRWIGKTAYLTEEFDIWKVCAQNWLSSCGIHRASVVLVADGFYGMGAAWGILEGIRSIGAVAMTSGAAPWEIIDEYGITACVLTADLLEQWIAGGWRAGGCRQIFCLTSGLDTVQRDRWQGVLGIPIYRQLGMEGIQDSVIFWEDQVKNGYHYLPQYYLPELIEDSHGFCGNLLLTALQRRSTTAIRVCTGWKVDLSRCQSQSTLQLY